jgi:hypothetical protein
MVRVVKVETFVHLAVAIIVQTIADFVASVRGRALRRRRTVQMRVDGLCVGVELILLMSGIVNTRIC